MKTIYYTNNFLYWEIIVSGFLVGEINLRAAEFCI